MAVDVQIPTLGESISDGVIVRWMKRDGETVAADEPLLELETDKASVEIPAPTAGVIAVLAKEGQTVRVGEVVARIEPNGAKAAKPAAAAPSPPPAAAPAPAVAPAPTATPAAAPPLSPAVRRLVEEKAIDPTRISGTGKGGRLTKGDVLAHLTAEAAAPAPAPAPAPTPVVAEAPRPPTPYPHPGAPSAPAGADVERVPMSRLRQRIAERLRQAQATAAILTTFNEVDMSAVLALRAKYKQTFADAHGVSLGFMSFFGRACVSALQDMPLVNAQIDGTDIVYNKRVHLGIAVGSERGLVVPIVHNADGLDFAGLEREIARLAQLARDNKLSIDDLAGGTFTISNGGVYGSLLSTPILNPPQSAILGMHKIEKRPVVVDDQVVVRPMMYLALSYDHRLIDGSEAVTFLVKVKERLEDPSRLLLGV
ncbi:MAG TPA: 2-oxoglutarate dehydrogenase complex dihydrolipoyllysine-residue succinyltransferase [Candidatus Dormibacteraeota bacterium]|nr:2-oxoglutarate dehydrogenase complex dihydrolipoyllysine-residue succinyltransferase [Candidatus Dormibacteraeota bacterium]